MADLVITRSGSPLRENDIAEFETEFDLKLPTQYRNFLLKYNGGRVNPGSFDFVEHGHPSRSVLNYFASLDQLYKTMHFLMEPRNPTSYFGILPNLLPIAYDPGGNSLCISLSGDNEGQIFFEAHDVPEGLNISFVASDFDAFLDSFYESRYEPPKLSLWRRLLDKMLG
jgi:cell wall assembly regulator SMI1